jgi:hypothetical protein
VQDLPALLTKVDKWLIAILLSGSLGAIAGGWYLHADGGDAIAEISVDGKVLQRVPLRAGYRQELRIGGDRQYDIIEVADGKVRVKEADCPEQDCVKMGWISRAPQQIVCLPYRIVIRIVANGMQDVDAIVR